MNSKALMAERKPFASSVGSSWLLEEAFAVLVPLDSKPARMPAQAKVGRTRLPPPTMKSPITSMA